MWLLVYFCMQVRVVYFFYHHCILKKTQTDRINFLHFMPEDWESVKLTVVAVLLFLNTYFYKVNKSYIFFC